MVDGTESLRWRLVGGVGALSLKHMPRAETDQLAAEDIYELKGTESCPWDNVTGTGSLQGMAASL